MKKYLLLISGPMCSGKTTTVDLLLESEINLFRISRDKIKRFISDYGTGTYKEFLDEIQLSLTRQAFTSGLNVIIEGSPNMGDTMRQKFKKITQEHQARFIEINLEATLPVLIERFYKRLTESQEKGFKLFCTTEERMLELYQIYTAHKNINTQTLITDSLTPQEVCKKIKDILVYC